MLVVSLDSLPVDRQSVRCSNERVKQSMVVKVFKKNRSCKCTCKINQSCESSSQISSYLIVGPNIVLT